MVLLFHGGVGWMSGGYVGVSVFFTLSVYLITALLLVEHERSGTIHWVAPCRLLLDEQLPSVLAGTRPDVVALMVTMRDVDNSIG